MLNRPIISFVSMLTLSGLGGFFAAPAEAQAKVTINGYIDFRGTYQHNSGLFDGDYTVKTNDKGWFHASRARLMITGEASPDLKGGLAFEYDVTIGQHQACSGLELAHIGCSGGRTSVESGATLGTDVQGIDQLKWLFIDFRVPETPARFRAGLFPVSGAQLKEGNLLISDVPGVDIKIPISDQLQAYLVAIKYEEHFGGSAAEFTLARGDDYAMLGNLKITPTKGLVILPVVAFQKIAGTTAITSRAPIAGLAPVIFAGGPGGCTGVALVLGVGGACVPDSEERWYFGVDAEWQVGNYYIAPTFIYMAGSRKWKSAGASSRNGGTPCAVGGTCNDSDIRSFLADVRGGAQFGPLRLEGFFQYTPGNSASEVAASGALGGGFSGGGTTVKYFQNIFVDAMQNTGWFLLSSVSDIGDPFGTPSGWSATAFAVNRQYQPGYGPWGHILIAGKTSYALSSTLTGRVVVGASWTEQKADKACDVAFTRCDGRGDANYLGTETNVGLIYRIYQGLTADAAFAYLFTGDAYSHRNRSVNDAWALSYKLAYSF